MTMTREETINFLRQKLEKNPKSILFARLADYYLKQKRINEALQLCSQGIENNPDYITGNYILAKIYMTMGEHEQAEAEFKKVISHDRYYLSAHKHLGDMMVKIGWENKAINHYKDILQLDPLEEEAVQMLETFSSEETSDEINFSEEEFPTSEDTIEPEEQSKETDMNSSEIDKELRKVFDEDDSSYEISKKDIELEEVTSQDESPSANSKLENLEYELPDDLNKGEIPQAQLTPETEKQEKSNEFQEEVSGEKESVTWNIPEDLTEKNVPSEKKEKEELQNLEITKPSDEEEEIDQSLDETVTITKDSSAEKISDTEIKTSPENENNLKETAKKETDKETDLSSEDSKETLSEISESEEKHDQPELSQPLIEEKEEGPQETQLPSDQDQSTKDTAEQKKQDEPHEPEKQKTDSDEKEKQSGDKNPYKEDNLVTSTLGEIYSAQGQLSKAIEVYKKLLEKNPDKKEYENKIQKLEKKLKKSP